jgi:hypothetical protein
LGFPGGLQLEGGHNAMDGDDGAFHGISGFIIPRIRGVTTTEVDVPLLKVWTGGKCAFWSIGDDLDR